MESCDFHLLKFFIFEKNKSKEYLKNLSHKELKRVCELLNFSDDWILVDQKIESFRLQMISKILKESNDIFHFLESSILKDDSRSLFQKGKATTMKRKKLKKASYWSSDGHLYSFNWLKKKYMNSFDSVVHFVQPGNGTGVCITKKGLILTCAHVVNNDNDKEDEILEEKRIGRIKVIMFPNTKLFICKCIACIESKNGKKDLALMEIVADIKGNPISSINFPFSIISNSLPTFNSDVFLIGNPSNLDLESTKKNEDNGIFPSVWHCSVGKIKGTSKAFGLGSIKHSSFTYWGHSGAPLFNKKGEIVGIHNSWDERDCMRHAISLEEIKEITKNYFV